MVRLRGTLTAVQSAIARGAPLLDQLLVSGGNFLTIAICAHTLSLEEQGKVGVVLSTYLITSIVNQTAILQMAVVRLAREHTTELLTLRLADLQCTVALITAIGITVSLAALGETIGMKATGWEMAVAGIFFWAQQLADFDRRISYSVASPTRGLASSMLVYPARIGLLVFLPFDSMAMVFTIAAATAVGPALYTISRMLRLPDGLAGRVLFYRNHAGMSRWLLAGAPFAWAWAQVPVYFLGSALGMAAVGAFVSIRSITNVANIGLEILETHFSPQLARLYYRRGPSGYRKSVLQVLAAGVLFWGLGLIVVTVAGDWIIARAVGDTYVQYGEILPWLWAGSLPYFLFRVDGIDLRNRHATRAIPLGFFLGTACSVVGCLLFIPSAGATGAAMARTGAATGLIVGQRAARPFTLRPPKP